jgi:hypothetical protein
MTDPQVDGATCLVVPSRVHVASYVALLTALQRASFRFPELLQRYVASFELGDRVRVLPSGHVYSFGGTMEYGDQRFFRLNLIDVQNGSRNFPMGDAVRLEKTTATHPKGKGDSLGKFQRSQLDCVIGTACGGNDALFENEVILVTGPTYFGNLLEDTVVSRSDLPDIEFTLADVITWGKVTPDGELEFKDSRASSGSPLVAVASRTEYAAAYCRRNKSRARVIVDGAGKVKDLQALDDVVDNGKVLIVADHSERDLFQEIASRNCRLWGMPGGMVQLVPATSTLLSDFCESYTRASGMRLNIAPCESDPVETIHSKIRAAEKSLYESESDDSITKFLGIILVQLFDLAALVSCPEETGTQERLQKLRAIQADMKARSIFFPPPALENLGQAIDDMCRCLEDTDGRFLLGKRNALLATLARLKKEGEQTVVVASEDMALKAADQLFRMQGITAENVMLLGDYLAGKYAENVILLGWPRKKNFRKLVERYAARNLDILAYPFERDLINNHRRVFQRQLGKLDQSTEGLAQITAIPVGTLASLGAVSDDRDPSGELNAVPQIDIEDRLSRVRKGTTVAEGLRPDETRPARYVGFVGTTYSYLTENHAVAKVTGILRGEHRSGTAVPLVTAEDLVVGDRILFRVAADTDKDIIRSLAEQLWPRGEYERIRKTAEQWKDALREIGDTPSAIAHALRIEGLARTTQAIRSWLTNPDVIGPAREHEDLVIIARAARDREFEKEQPLISEAITKIRGIHLTAGFKLTELLVRELPNQIPALSEAETIVELTTPDGIRLGKVAIVEIEDIADASEERPYWETNRLLYEG